MTNEDVGRGVFASMPLKQGELIVVENAIVQGDSEKQLVKKLLEINSLKGIEAMRMEVIYDGRDYEKDGVLIPPADLYVWNYYKKYKIPAMKASRIA